jgi:SAM-dependent methyltransferase
MLSATRIARGLFSRMDRARLRLQTGGAYFCNACGHDVPGFFAYGPTRVWGCPRCGSSPRERFVRHAAESGLLHLPGKGGRILHMAPSEQSLVALFSASGAEHVRADIYPASYPGQDVRRIDLCDFPATGESFDLIYASHVLEHILDDGLAMRNIRANLTPTGEAWIIVPLHDRPTEDGGPDLSGRERERRFGQWDHVRFYGEDIALRLQLAGFAVERFTPTYLAADVRERQGLADADTLWRCRPVAL